MPDPRPTLLIIDVQRAFDDPRWGRRNNPDAEERVASLLRAWRAVSAPLIHVRHRSRSSAGLFWGDRLEFKDLARPIAGETVVEKQVNSAFIGTNLDALLKESETTALVIAGLTTDHCCSTTARMAANLGYEVAFVSDATATFARAAPNGRAFTAEDIHDTALASLAGEFAEIVDTSHAIDRIGEA